jgi:hypothetical protein
MILNRSITAVFTVQNNFIKTHHGTSISRNCTNFVIFENLSDSLSLSILSRTIFSSSRFLVNCFKYVDENLPRPPGGLRYLIVFAHPQQQQHPSAARTATAIFPAAEGELRTPIFMEPTET